MSQHDEAKGRDMLYPRDLGGQPACSLNEVCFSCGLVMDDGPNRPRVCPHCGRDPDGAFPE